jgi:hypothetical protein
MSPPEVIARFDELFERRYPTRTTESAALLDRIGASCSCRRDAPDWLPRHPRRRRPRQRLGGVCACVHPRQTRQRMTARPQHRSRTRWTVGNRGRTGAGYQPLQLSYLVTYGVWLETKESGRYAVITPAMRVLRDKLLSDLGGIIDHMRSRTT